MTTGKSLSGLLPTEPIDLESGLSLIPRVRLNLTVHRADKSVSPIDEWKLKNSLINYLKSSHSISVTESDIIIHKYRDMKKRKREDPVARGSLLILDLGFMEKKWIEDEGVEKVFLEWRKGIVEKMNGIEMNLEGVKFTLSVVLPLCDDFEGMKKEWEEIEAFGNKGYRRGEKHKQQPDTIIVRGVPSRWFAETRVSSKPSMLVTHTIFSALGNIRNLDVAEDNDIGEDEDEDGGNIASGLNCKIVVRFKSHQDFYNALKVLSGRSLIKPGSSLRADYEANWDKDRFFENSRSQVEEKRRWAPAGSYRSEAPGRGSRLSPEDPRRKRFKE